MRVSERSDVYRDVILISEHRKGGMSSVWTTEQGMDFSSNVSCYNPLRDTPRVENTHENLFKIYPAWLMSRLVIVTIYYIPTLCPRNNYQSSQSYMSFSCFLYR